MSAAKPKTVQGDLQNFPATLKRIKRWVCWRWKLKDGAWTKPPYQVNGRLAKTDDPNTWNSHEACVAAVNGEFEGVGLNLLDLSLGVFDIDNCRAENGELAPFARELMERCGSYAEITPSGRGVRIIGLAKGKHVHRKQSAGDGVSCETYRHLDSGRYITVTGAVVPGYAVPLRNIDAIIDELVARLDGDGKKDSGPEFDETDAFPDIEPDDPRLKGLEAKWIKLGQGGGIEEKYEGDRSRAVMAFATACLRAGIDRAVLAACLMRWPIGDHIREQHNVTRALNRTIDRAQEFVEDSKLFEMNETYCVLPIGGKTRVASWGEDADFPGHRTIVRFATFDDFKALHNKYRHTIEIEGERKEVPLGSWWLGQRNRRQYDNGMRFMPERDVDVVDGTLNLWSGFAVRSSKSGAAGCKLFLEHGRKIICSGNEEHYDYLIKREAFIAQRRTRSEIAAGFRTEVEGTGKGFWCRGINHLYGRHAMEVQNPNHVVGKHNTHLESLLRLTADEALFALDPNHRNALYNLITEPRITIEPKFVDAYAARNHLNIDVISNAPHFLPVGGTARRFFVPTVSSDRANDHKYFGKILAELHDGGYAALLHHLLHEIDIRDFNVRDVPKTAALAEQATYSRRGIDRLVEIACNDGIAPCQNGAHPGGISVCSDSERGNPIRRGLDHFIDHHADRELNRLGSLTVKRRLAKEWGCVTGTAARQMVDGTRKHCVVWPPLDELRKRFAAKHGKQEWAYPDLEEWLDPSEGVEIPSTETPEGGRNPDDILA